MGRVPELPEVEALAADLRERAVGRVIDRADVAEIAVLKTYDPALTALGGRTVTGTGRHGKFLDLVTQRDPGDPPLHLIRTWPGQAGCAGVTSCPPSRPVPAGDRWRSGSGSVTGRDST